VVKAVLYTSPLLILPLLFAYRFELERLKVFVFYIIFGLFFYTILFDFSIGALDRYLQFIVIPLSALSAAVLVRLFRENGMSARMLVFGCFLALLVCSFQFLPHWVPPLHPKAEWIGRILSLNWTFLYPFSGGSGPLGFYVSFFFIGITWVVTVGLFVGAYFKLYARTVAIAFLLPLGLMYNGVFAEEYLLGKINGFTPALVTRTVQFIAENPDITKVVVYNDNGGNEVQETGKYEKRLYTSPQFPVEEKVKTMNAFSGHYMVVDVPPVDPKSVYAKYFATCEVIYHETDRAMNATVYDCRKAPPIVL
jgi:hypothetical protein